MQAHTIISNVITNDIRQHGHQSIRFSPGGFSVLVTDASYKPVWLNHYLFDLSTPVELVAVECRRIMEELEFYTFNGETVIVSDSPAVTIIPSPFYKDETARTMLEHANTLPEKENVFTRFIKDRAIHIVFSFPEVLESLTHFLQDTQVIHTTECLISLSDQVQASDHQRGMMLVEIQRYTMELLVIIEDEIRLCNRYSLKDTSEFIYHILNTFRQLGLDREKLPVYLAGIINGEHELHKLLGKYIRNPKPIPYYLEGLSKEQVLKYMILSEASKCA